MPKAGKVDLLKSAYLTVLSDYLSPTLFSETNLPQVAVFSKLPTGSEEDRFLEDIELVLSLYGVGKVTFRHDYRYGGIIPAIGAIYVDSLGSYLKTTALLDDRMMVYRNEEICPEIIPDNLRRYVEYLREKAGDLISRGILGLRPLKISIPCYYYYNVDKFLLWKLWPKSLTTTSKIYFPEHKSFFGKKALFLDIKTTSYPFIFTNFASEYSPSQLNALANLQEILTGVLSFTYRVSDVLKGVYAYETHYAVRVLDPSILHKVSINGLSDLAAPEDVKHWKRYYSTSKVLFLKPSIDEYLPCVLLYKIEKTNALKISLETIVQDFKNFVNFASSMGFYENLIINDTILNFYLHILAGDLRLKEVFPRNLLELLRTSFIWKEIFMKDVLMDKMHVNTAKEALNFFREAIEELSNLCKNDISRLRLKLFLSLAERFIYIRKSLENLNLEEINQIFHKILQDYKNLHNIGFIVGEVLLHSYAHYLLSTFIKRGGASDIAIQEIFPALVGVNAQTYYNMRDFFTRIALYEASSGGLGVISSVLRDLSMKNVLLINDFLVSPGECLIGTPEDIIYYFLLSKEDLKEDFSENCSRLEKISNSLGIIVTFNELREASRLLQNLRQEAQSLITYANINTDPLDLMREIARARNDFEHTNKHTPTINGLTLWIFKNLNNYRLIREVILTLSTDALVNYWIKSLRNKYKEGIEPLSRYFTNILGKQVRITNDDISKDRIGLRLLLDRLINDVIKFLDTGNSALSEVYSKLHGKEKNAFSGAISYLLQQLRSLVVSAFYRLYLLTCSPACGWCMLNTKGCSITQMPEVQVLFLNRRLLKLFFSFLARQLERSQRNVSTFREQVPDGYKEICEVKIGGDILKYCVRVSSHET